MYVCASHAYCVLRDRKRAPDTLKLDLQNLLATCSSWHLNPNPLEEQSLFIITDTPFRPGMFIF